MGNVLPGAPGANNYTKIIAAILLFCFLIISGYLLQHTVSCFLLSWIIAYLLDPLLVRVEGRGVRRIYALGLLYVVLGFLSIFFLMFMLPKITISWYGFTNDLPLYIQKLKQIAMEWKARIPDRYGSDEIQWLLDQAYGNIDTAVQKAVVLLYAFGAGVLFNIFNLVLAPILVFFMLYYKQTVIETLTSWLPERHGPLILDIGREVSGSIGGYLRGQVFVSIIVAFLGSVALFILNVPHPVLCGIFAGAASVLPFVGVFIAIIPALFFTWFKYQTMVSLLQTGISFAIIYFLEGYVIKPLVFKQSMNLNPLVTILMVMALGELIGFWGIMLALPIASALKITWGHFIAGDFSHKNQQSRP